MSEAQVGPQDVQKVIDRSPYLTWLGLNVTEFGNDGISVTATWRPEWVANPDRGQTQGGILGSLIDFAANFALFEHTRRPVLTIDLRIDYHRMATKGNLVANGRIVKLGRTFSVCEAEILDERGKLVASGRGSFLTAEG